MHLKRILTNGLLSVSSLIIILILLEGIFRLPVVVSRTGGNTPGILAFRDQYDKLWEQHPSQWMRTAYLPNGKKADTLRIAVLGDSYTWGDGIAHTKDLWTSHLERDLNAANSIYNKIEVVNMGQCGFTTFNEHEYFMTAGYRYQPDMVIVQVGVNDALPSVPGFKRAPEQFMYLPERHIMPNAALHKFFDEHSYLYSFVNARIFPPRLRPEFSHGYSDLYKDGSRGWKEMRWALAKLIKHNRDHNIKTVVMVFVYRYHEGFKAIAEKITRYAHTLDVPVLNLYPVFSAVTRRDTFWYFLPQNQHPNEAAHKLAGETLARFMIDNNLLP